MNKEIVVNNSTYVFDGETLELFLKTNDTSESEQVDNSVEFCYNKKELYKLVFNVANMCNLNCKYCYASGGNYKRQNEIMSKEIVDKILEKVFSKYEKVYTVYFFGGEPLLNFKVIKYAVEQLESKYNSSDLDFRTVTNGMFLTKTKAEFFKDHDFKVYISIDGPKKIHDYLRGHNTFDVIMENIKEIKQLYPELKIELLCTYTKYHQDNISLEELNEFFKQLGYPYNINGVDTNDKSLKLVEEKSFVEREKDFVDISIDRILSYDDNVGVSYYLTSVLDALLFKNKQKYFCKELANNYSNVFDFNGEEYSCIRLLGTYKKDDKKILEANEKNFEQCQKCPYKNLCNVCVAEILLGVNEYPFDKENNKCNNQQLYDYALHKIVSLLDGDTSKFEKMVHNYCQKYLR